MGKVKCKDSVSGLGEWGRYPCPNNAKYDGYCGVHSPEKKAERAKARGPSLSDREWQARDKERERVRDMETRLATLEAEKAGAYAERDKLVTALSKCFPSWLRRHPESDKEWEDDWRWIVMIKLPTGQVSWHIHDSETGLFSHLEHGEEDWDGHDTEEKYRRVAAIDAAMAKGEG